VLRLSGLAEATVAEGPHRRFAVWVQGCSLRCPGCCNPEMFDPRGGFDLTVADLLERIASAERCHGIEGITILGGEPLEQLPAVARLAEEARRRGLGVVLFSGLRLGEARARPGFDRMWRALDTMVDGRFERANREPVPGRRFVGSANQRILHRTLRYAAPSLWRGSPRVEIHVDSQGGLEIMGFPLPVQRLVRALRATGHARSSSVLSLPHGTGAPHEDPVLAHEE
jgi:anaerobic ribonucleoside-triphosphate reductase activating protein